MKKSSLLFCVSLVFIFFFSASFAESVEESVITGIWVSDMFVYQHDYVSLRIYQFLDNHIVYYQNTLYMSEGKGNPSISSNLYTWTINGDKINVKGDSFNNDLYLISDTCISEYPKGTEGLVRGAFYSKVPDIDSLFVSESINLNPCGKWSCLYEAKDQNHHDLNFDIFSADLFLLEDGSVNMSLGTVSQGETKFDYSYFDGLWLGDYTHFRIRTNDSVFDCWIDDAGFLHLQFTDTFVFVFTRINPSENFSSIEVQYS